MANAVNYLSLAAVQAEINRIPRERYECVLYGVWNTILTWQFRVENGYVTRPQDRHSRQRGRAGYSDLHTYQYPAVGRRASKFLIVQCKKHGHEGEASTWTQGRNQLRQYLSNTHGRRRWGTRTPVYGILSVGHLVRFYKYVDVGEDIRDLNIQSILRSTRIRNGDSLHIQTDCRQIQRILNHIRSHH
ncbi:hypothetical protein N7468_001748 [Penicillium chermesinum]|uniref:Uncharacterized protein n=1 Tax=Penicillium chermesinum TaxID=63820 RepID=A0A9W9PHD5_9EURO|nr:uncharacterized protein N7468_001748 [Penicillium chermesinum]KAJ5246765.1 hypothetical protein N7468_001748 [Penicillium chermesinum]KAJ6145030.1 hypothetical protein N7470_008925 [Penicillium chermesinum]